MSVNILEKEEIDQVLIRSDVIQFSLGKRTVLFSSTG